MVSINGTDMTWHGSCQGVEGQKNAEFERNQRKKLEPHKNCPLHISHGYQKQFYSATPYGDRQYYMDHIAKHLLP